MFRLYLQQQHTEGWSISCKPCSMHVFHIVLHCVRFPFFLFPSRLPAGDNNIIFFHRRLTCFAWLTITVCKRGGWWETRRFFLFFLPCACTTWRRRSMSKECNGTDITRRIFFFPTWLCSPSLLYPSVSLAKMWSKVCSVFLWNA